MGEKYHTPFLKEVIVRMDFASPIDETQRALPKELSNLALKSFPIPEPRGFLAKELEITPTSAPKEKQSEGTDWFFHGRQKEKTLCITRDHAFITYSRYDSFESLKGDLFPIAQALFDTYKGLQVIRFGLRYINRIELSENNPLEWSTYLDKKLLSAFEVPKNRETICRAFNNLSMNYGDLILQFQYGIHNPDFPAPIKRKVFILDYDAYYRGPQDLSDLTQNIDKFHEKIEEFFESNITNKLRNLMGVAKNA